MTPTPAFESLPPAALKLSRIKAAIFGAVLALVATALVALEALFGAFDVGAGPLAAGAAAALTPVIAWLAAWPPARWRHRQWRLTETSLDYHSGVVFHSEITVPRSRVQHTEVTQGPLQRRFGLATLSIYTAGERFAHVGIEGLDAEVARSLRDELLNHRPDHVV